MTPDAYSTVITKVNPMAAKYLPGAYGPGTTCCNFFVADLADALGTPLPRKTANEQIAWLASAEGKAVGWEKCDAVEARFAANAGSFTLATWVNDKGHGHIAAVCPFNSDAVWIAQAGRQNYLAAQIAAGFGSYPVRFFTYSR